MSKTISAFFQFVKDDPIMLGLCLAIGVLIILFIIVLLLGKKTEKKDKADEKEERIMKTQVDLNVIKDASSSVKDNPIFASQPYNDDSIAIPIETSEPKSVELAYGQGENEKSVPSYENFDRSVEFPHIDSNTMDDNLAKMTESEGPVVETPVFAKEDYVGTPTPGIIESTVSPVDPTPTIDQPSKIENDFPNIFDTYSEEKKVSDLSQEEKPIESSEKSLREIYGYDEADLPEVKPIDFSRTAIIRQASLTDTKVKDAPKDEITEDEDDIVLPKLKTTNDSKPAFNISGESFDVPKNS